MNIIQMWYLLSKPDSYYCKLSFNYQNVIDDINLLDKKRRDLQKRIVELSQSSMVCFDCQGKCCCCNYNHFTVIDYLIRCHSDHPIKSYDKVEKPSPFINLVINKLRHRLTNTSGMEEIKNRTEKCPDLGDGGCKLLPEDRPIRCIIWTCTDFKKEFDQKKLRQIGYLTKELEGVVKEVMRKYKRAK